MSRVKVRLTGRLVLLAVGALAVPAVAVGVTACAPAVDRGGPVSPPSTTPSPPPLDPDAENLRRMCGSAPPEEGSYFCLGRDPSFSPSDLVIPGYEN